MQERQALGMAASCRTAPLQQFLSARWDTHNWLLAGQPAGLASQKEKQILQLPQQPRDYRGKTGRAEGGYSS